MQWPDGLKHPGAELLAKHLSIVLPNVLCSSMRCCGLGWVGGPLGLPTSRSSFGVFSVVHFSVAFFS